MPLPNLIIAADLVSATSQAVVDRYFDDDGDGMADPALLDLILANTTGAIYAKLLSGFSAQQVALFAQEPLFKMHGAFVALHLAAKRRTEWRDAQGNAPFRTDWNDAMKYFSDLSSGNTRSPQESIAGTHPVIGGNQVAPLPQQPTYIFAPDPNNKNYQGSGGY